MGHSILLKAEESFGTLTFDLFGTWEFFVSDLWKGFETKDEVTIYVETDDFNPTYGKVVYPRFAQKKGRKIDVALHLSTRERYPSRREVVTHMERLDPVTRKLRDELFMRSKTQVVTKSMAELFVFFVSKTMFPVLRKFRLVPGRSSAVQSNRYGIACLEKYRAWSENNR